MLRRRLRGALVGGLVCWPAAADVSPVLPVSMQGHRYAFLTGAHHRQDTPRGPCPRGPCHAHSRTHVAQSHACTHATLQGTSEHGLHGKRERDRERLSETVGKDLMHTSCTPHAHTITHTYTITLSLSHTHTYTRTQHTHTHTLRSCSDCCSVAQRDHVDNLDPLLPPAGRLHSRCVGPQSFSSFSFSLLPSHSPFSFSCPGSPASSLAPAHAQTGSGAPEDEGGHIQRVRRATPAACA